MLINPRVLCSTIIQERDSIHISLKFLYIFYFGYLIETFILNKKNNNCYLAGQTKIELQKAFCLLMKLNFIFIIIQKKQKYRPKKPEFIDHVTN